MKKSRPQTFTQDDVEIVRKTPLYQGFFTMNGYDVKHSLFAGGQSAILHREMFERGHAVALLPYDPVTDEFVLIEQFRLGAMATCQSPWLIEVIAGMIDEGFSADAICHKEAREEANITLTHLHEVCSYLSSPGGTTERIYIYIATTDSSAANGVHGCENEGEDIKVHRVQRHTAKQWLNNGVIDNAAAMIALQHFFLNEHKYVTND